MARSHETIVLGAGPAGLQVAYDLAKARLDYLVLERGPTAGTFFRSYPRHRTMISVNKRFTGFDDIELNLRWDWNSIWTDEDRLLFKHWSKDYFPHADTYVEYLAEFAQQAGLAIAYDTEVTRVDRDEQGFILTDGKGETYRCKRLVVATGVSKPYLPPIEGIEHAEPYSEVSVDAEEFANQRVLILGKANSAFETANNLLATASVIHLCSPNPVTLAWKSKFVGHLRSVNGVFVDSYLLKSQNVLLNGRVSKIARRDDGALVATVEYGHANGEVEDLVYDRVIAATGFRFDASLFTERCRPVLAIEDRFPAQTSAFESTNVKDLYFAGTLTQVRDFKKKQSGFIHGFRYNARALARVLSARYHDVPWPSRPIRATAAELTKAVLARVNQSSALFQQTGFICDAIVLEGGQAHYYEDLPTDYAHDCDLGRSAHYYTVTLEWNLEIIGRARDPLAVERVHKDDVARASESSFVHPIIRRYEKGRLVSTHHIIEDLDGLWLEEVHEKPLLQYFAANVEPARPGAPSPLAPPAP